MNAVLAGLIGMVIALVVAHGRVTAYDNYVLLAYSLLHGHIWIDQLWPGPSIDAVLFEGHRFIVNDPVPALLMLPLVSVYGIRANETLMACLMCGVAIGAAWALLERLEVPQRTGIWLVAFMLAGTDLLWCSMLGDVWFMAQTCAVAFLLLALWEAAGPRRGWLVGLFTALALGSRFTLVMAVPVMAWWVWTGFERRELRPRALGTFLLTLVPFFVVWLAYNEVRWHVPWDAGHTIFYHQDPYMGSPTGSPFSLGNVGDELWSFFVAPPELHPNPPYLEPLNPGTALWFTSPALLLALFARRPRRLVLSLWVAVALVAAPSFLYYANGGAQFGMRHALDFEPFLLVLMALAVREGLAWFWQVLIGWSVAAGLWGCWFWDTFARPYGY